MTQLLVDIDDLVTEFATSRGPLRAVDGVSLELRAGETLGIVGESGSGKSVLARTIMGLLPAGSRTAGTVRFDGMDLQAHAGRGYRKLWGTDLAMVFQDASTALNPVKRVGTHVSESLRRHLKLSRRDAAEQAIDLLDQVGIADPRRRSGQYPHELSGGMRQRVTIAVALACEPRLLVADEPTTALDVTVQRQILDLLGTLQAERNMAMILITHDLGVVAGRTDRVAVMYAGRLAETARTSDLFSHIRHPYTEALVASVPSIDHPSHARLAAIPGRPPDGVHRPAGCRFAPRCRHADDRCTEVEPALVDVAPGHTVACHHPVDTVAANLERRVARRMVLTVGADATSGDAR